MSNSEQDVAHRLTDARAGRRAAFDQVVEACSGYLNRVARERLDPDLRVKGGASDLVQETFLAAHQHFDRFRGDTEAELLGWLRKTLLHKVAKFKRRYLGTRKRRLAAEVHLRGNASRLPGDDLAAAGPSPSEQVIRNEEAEAVHQALERLTEHHRRVLLLRIYEQLSFEEVGRQMGRTANAAEKLFARAIRAARHQLQTLP